MVGLNWLILLADSEKIFHNFFNLKGLFDLPHWVIITRTLLENRPTLYFQLMGEPILIEDLVGANTLRNVQPLLNTMGCWLVYLDVYQSILVFTFCQIVGLVLHTMGRFETIVFGNSGWLPKTPVFIFCQIVRLVFQTWYVCRRGGANKNCHFSRKNMLMFL